MIQNLRNVDDSLCVGNEPKREIVVLSPSHLRPEAAEFARQIRPIDTQMTSVHASQKVLGRPIWLKEGVATETLFIDLVFVAVKEVPKQILVVGKSDLKQCIRRNFIVVIEKRHKFAGRQP